MIQKLQIHEWKSQLYPVRIWIAVTNNINDLENKFCDLRDESDLLPIDNKHLAFVQSVIHKESRNAGVLIIFTKKSLLTPQHMAHEATHASDEIWEYVGEKSPGTESNAYLVEWIVNLMEQVRKNKFES